MRDQGNEKTRKKLERLAWFLDSSIKVPGFNARFGLDGLIGLIPGVGDVISALISSVVISEAARMGAPKTLLLKMAFNVLVDTVVGAVPLVGDLFDFAWKANNRNVSLLNRYLDSPRETEVTSRVFVWGLSAALLGLVVLVGYLLVLLLQALFNAVGA
ncbi:DUF4112 domain-containing protein [Halopseudomonas salina]|uniref:DUF4112 domain-containing protein n=1 Tax=Halopseudomonas salina TaxID=1323744 RepID=A0ABQ1PVV2_9GAMM|nr:DUF4112 domain-containing protein [Halopseudomonas salina]GGD05402.1 hypothetical protein GCM10007418_25500 [Halopseudomonas salina]